MMLSDEVTASERTVLQQQETSLIEPPPTEPVPGTEPPHQPIMLPATIPHNGQKPPPTHSDILSDLVHEIQKTKSKNASRRAEHSNLDRDMENISHDKDAYHVGVDTLPGQIQDLKHKRGAKFNLLLVGQQGSGKTTFINTLFGTKIMPTIWDTLDDIKPHVTFEKKNSISTHRVNLIEKGFNLDLTLIETQCLNDYIDNMFAYIPITEYIDEHLRRYMFQDEQPDRSEKVDNRVHACLFFINPSSRGLSPSEIECMKHISSRVNLIPVISKADTLTTQEIEETKDLVRRIIKRQAIKICEFVDDEEVKLSILKQCPFALIGSESFFSVDCKDGSSQAIRGRKYKWGVADVMNPQHCDFIKLRDVLMGDYMADLISTTETYYEKCRGRLIETRVKGISKVFKRAQNMAVNGAPANEAEGEDYESCFADLNNAQQTLLEELLLMNLNYDEVEHISGLSIAKALFVFDKNHVDKLVADWNPVYLHNQLQMKRMLKEEAKKQELKHKSWKQSLALKQQRYNDELSELRDLIQTLKSEIKALQGAGEKSKSKPKGKKAKESDPSATLHDELVYDESIQADAIAAADAIFDVGTTSSAQLNQELISRFLKPPSGGEIEAESITMGTGININTGTTGDSVSTA